MATHALKNWWQNRREAAKCSELREELRLLLYGGSGDEEGTARRLIEYEKYRYPGQSESWYLDKVIYGLRRRFSAS